MHLQKKKKKKKGADQQVPEKHLTLIETAGVVCVNKVFELVLDGGQLAIEDVDGRGEDFLGRHAPVALDRHKDLVGLGAKVDGRGRGDVAHVALAGVLAFGPLALGGIALAPVRRVPHLVGGVVLKRQRRHGAPLGVLFPDSLCTSELSIPTKKKKKKKT